jgi:hypothetical protein
VSHQVTEPELAEDDLKNGSHPPYRWLTSNKHYMGTFVKLCPEVVLGRSLAMTSIDSGDPTLTDTQRSNDWQSRSGIVYSPRLTSTGTLFYQRDGSGYPGYDEWYLFETNPPELGELIRRNQNPFEPAHAPSPQRLMVFVNYPAFVLHDLSEKTLANLFWKQLEWVEPESYVATAETI